MVQGTPGRVSENQIKIESSTENASREAGIILRPEPVIDHLRVLPGLREKSVDLNKA